MSFEEFCHEYYQTGTPKDRLYKIILYEFMLLGLRSKARMYDHVNTTALFHDASVWEAMHTYYNDLIKNNTCIDDLILVV